MPAEDEVYNGSCFKILAMLILGLLCLLIIVGLTYFTVESIAGRFDFCNLWTDIPGRLAIFMICYYVAGLCGLFPIPVGCCLNCSPQPLILWRLETWRRLFSCFLPTPSPYSRFLVNHETPAQSSTSPMGRDGHQESYGDGYQGSYGESYGDSYGGSYGESYGDGYQESSRESCGDGHQESVRESTPTVHRRQSEPAQISGTKRTSPLISVPVQPDETVSATPEQMGKAESIGGGVFKFSCSPVGCAIPMAPEPQNLPSMLEEQAALHEPFEQRENPDPLPRTENTGHPRFDWRYLRGEIPRPAIRIHMHNLAFERRMIAIQERIRRDNAIQERIRRDDAIQERIRRDDAIQERIRRDDAIQERIRRDDAIQERIRRDDAIQERIRRDKEKKASKGAETSTRRGAEGGLDKVNPQMETENTERVDVHGSDTAEIPTTGRGAEGGLDEVNPQMETENTERVDVHGSDAAEIPTSSNQEPEEENKIAVRSRKDKSKN